MEDDDAESYDPAIEKFGDEELVAEYGKPERIQELVDAGNVVTANAILAACYTGSEHTLEILLSERPDPEVRLPGVDRKYSGVKSGSASSDVSPNFGVDKREWYPLQHAVTGPFQGYGGKEASNRVTGVLLLYKPDFFATFKQPIWRSDPFPFPGDKDLRDGDISTPTSHTSSDEYLHSLDMVDGEWQKKPDPECGYGLRSVLHSLFEDGAFIKPILGHPNLDLDLSQRDPQGRTLLHSACRSAVGADAIIDAVIEDIFGELRNKPLIAPEASETSLFHTLRKRGADLLVEDYNGKNILHHLLEARTPHPYSTRPPLIRNTLKYILKHETSLVNRPDRHGTYPLHAALQRLRGQLELTIWLEDSPLEPVVHDILDGGANATTHDSRGNNALHYLADNGLAEQWRGIEARALARRFCEAGVDVNARNNQGRTPLEILMDDSGKLHKALWSRNAMWQNSPPSLEQIDQEVFTMFDESGARWTEQDPQGRTLLHLAAKYSTPKTAFRIQYLLNKGANPSLKDPEGRTVTDLAMESDNKMALEALQDDHRSENPNRYSINTR